MDKVLRWGIRTISLLMLLLLTANLWMLIDKKLNHKDFPTIFGWSYAVVRSNSMKPTFSKGSVLILHEEPNYQIHDIVTYKEPMDTSTTTHRLVAKTPKHYITKGDANTAEDLPITPSMVYAKVLFVIPYLGLFSLFLQNKLVLVLIVFIGIIYLARKKEAQ